MSFYSPSTSFYPCPIRAADVFKPQPPPPPTYYLTDHVRIEYNDSDWGEEEASAEEEVNGSNHTAVAGHPSTVVRARPPLGLLSVKMREHREKEEIGSDGSKDDKIPKDGWFASPAERSAPAVKADITQGTPSVIRKSKVIAESNVKPRARKPLVAANANARKKSKVTSKPSRRRVQVVLTHAKEEKENHPHVSSDSDDEIDDPLVHARSTQKTLSNWAAIIGALPDPFVLTSSDECDDPLEGGQNETKRPTAGAHDKVEGITTKDSDIAPVTTAETTDVGNARTPKSCLRAANAPSKGHTVAFKESLLKFHFYYHPDPDDVWSRCGLSMRPALKLRQQATY